jgi:GNAT superfamily N-acetyltransferase
MTSPERYDAFTLMLRFRSDQAALGDALSLFVEREDYGFVWLAYNGDTCVGCCSIAYAITTEAGGVTAMLRDLYVLPEARRQGVASAMLANLHKRLDALGIRRIDALVIPSPELHAFLRSSGFSAPSETTFRLER